MIGEQLINALSLGVAIALAALAFSLFLGVVRVLHLAIGELFMVGAITAAAVARGGNGLTWSIVMAVPFTAAVGSVVFLVAIRPLRGRSDPSSPQHRTVLLSTIGIGMVLQAGAMAVGGSTPREFPSKMVGEVFTILHISAAVLLSLGALVLSLIGFLWLIRGTQFGLRIRAIADNPMLALRSGVALGRNEFAVVALGSGLAGLGGALTAHNIGAASPASGGMYAFKGLVVALIAGPENLARGVVVAFGLALLETAVVYAFGASYRDAVTFGILVVFYATAAKPGVVPRRRAA